MKFRDPVLARVFAPTVVKPLRRFGFVAALAAGIWLAALVLSIASL